MDNLTHTLTGLMLSRAGFNRWCPMATPILLLAVNVPDADIVVRLLSDSLTYLDHHRGITHGLAAAPVLGALVVGALAAIRRTSMPWFRAVVTATTGVLSHLLLDWTNTYGIHLLAPFSNAWLRLDIINVVDLWIWALLLIAVAGPLLSKLVSSEIGAKPSNGRGAAVFALIMLTLYAGARYALHERAINTLDSHMYSGAPAKRTAAFPHFANPFVWNTHIDTANAVILQRVNLLFPYDPMGGVVHYWPQRSEALEATLATPTVQRFLNFAQFPFWQITPLDKPEGAVKVEVMDLRFGDPNAPRFVATVMLDAGARVTEESFSFGPLRPR
jgi:inner membrane protein